MLFDDLMNVLIPTASGRPPREGTWTSTFGEIGTSMLGIPSRLKNIMDKVIEVVSGWSSVSWASSRVADDLAWDAVAKKEIKPSTAAAVSAIDHAVWLSSRGKEVDRLLRGKASTIDVIGIGSSLILSHKDFELASDAYELEKQFLGAKKAPFRQRH
jgi:hypothetical protein